MEPTRVSFFLSHATVSKENDPCTCYILAHKNTPRRPQQKRRQEVVANQCDLGKLATYNSQTVAEEKYYFKTLASKMSNVALHTAKQMQNPRMKPDQWQRKSDRTTRPGSRHGIYSLDTESNIGQRSLYIRKVAAVRNERKKQRSLKSTTAGLPPR